LAGCREDEIRSYSVPKPETLPKVEVKPKVRLLGAIFPRGDMSWFIKLMGPVEAVDSRAAEFDRFVGSLRFHDKDDPPIQWTEPEGWKPMPPSGFFYARFALGGADGTPLELTVSFLGGSVLDNVNRWRGQIGLKPVLAGELDKTTTRLAVGGVEGYRIGLGGPGAGSGMGKPRSP
jgi:hypothetical protein